MGWKCVPQVMGLVRGDGMRRDGKGQAKHRANVAAIIHEAFEIADQNDGHPIPIRKSAPDTYDRSRTPNNRYTGYQTADDVVAALEEEATAQTVEVQTKDKKTGETVVRKRPLRSDAVIGVAVIFKPPCAIARTWSRDQYDKFINDSLDVMAMVQCGGEVDKKTGKLKRGQEPCRLFRRENIIAGAEHWDEGSLSEGKDVYTGHWHKIYKPEDENGKYRGNLIDPYFLSRLSAVYPGMMRERGWDIEDCDCTDWEKFNDDKNPENTGYKAKRKSKIRQGGKSVNKYIASAEREAVVAQYDEAGAMLDKAVALGQALKEQAEADADAIREQARSDADKMKKNQEVAQQELESIQMKGDLLKGGLTLLENVRSNMQKELDAKESALDVVESKAETAKADVEAARAEKARLEQEAAVIRQQLDADKAARDKLRQEAEAAKIDRDTAKAQAKTACDDRDAAREEANELHRTAVARAEQEAMAMRDKIEADTREAWRDWLERKEQYAENTAAKIIADAKAKAAEFISAATGEYAFLLKWLANQKYQSGVTFLARAREAYRKEIREQRVSEMPAGVRGAGKGQPGQDGPEKG
jgi:vacuolar-type H+-ATPase subunit H